jgi:hypothetical protein
MGNGTFFFGLRWALEVEACRSDCYVTCLHAQLNRFQHLPLPVTRTTQALFSLQKNLQNFSDFPSHRIFEHMHEALNIYKK